jgi:predicted phosphohydrolase
MCALYNVLIFMTLFSIVHVSSVLDEDSVKLFNIIDINNDMNINAQELVVYFDKLYSDDEDNGPNSYTTTLFDEGLIHLQKTFLKRKILQERDQFMMNFKEYEHIMSQFSQFHKNDKTDCPQQVHLALGRNASEMVIIWITFDKVDAIVTYGQSFPGNMSQTGETYTYNAGYLFGWHGWIHKVVLQGLKRATTYYYQVGSSNPDACWSKKLQFTTNGKNLPLNIAIYGDQGAPPLGLPVMERILWDHERNPFDLVVHVGDIAYAGTGKEIELEFLWDLWGRMVSDLSSVAPYMTSVGNHEKYYSFAAYQNRFHMPGRHDPDHPFIEGNFFYSFDYGNVHFVSMCTETYVATYDSQSPQYKFLESDFASVNRTKTPFVVLLGHRPMYSSDIATDSGPLRDLIEPLMIKYRVDVGVWGHMHVYERTHPVQKNIPDIITGNIVKNAKNPIHFTIGTAGALFDSTFYDPAPNWSAYRSNAYGYVRWTLVNFTTMHFEFLDLWDTAKDELWLIRE